MIFTRDEAKFLCTCSMRFLNDGQRIPTLTFEETRKPVPSWLEERDAELLFVLAINKLFAPCVSAMPLTPEEILALWYAVSYTVNAYEIPPELGRAALPVSMKLGDRFEQILPALPRGLSALQGSYLPEYWDEYFAD